MNSVIGHSQNVALLRKAVARERVPQALLFAGPEGVGKRAIAVALAAAVNCPNVTDGSGCGSCQTCRRIARGQHTDVVLIDRGGEASIKIRPIRERLLEVVGYRPFEGRRRVFIIDPADDLTLEAQDALLKTLEEPPPAVIIILVTSYPDTLRPTVLSRCRRLRFGLLVEEAVAGVLRERCGVDAGKADALARVSGGSVSRALAQEAGVLRDDRQAALGLLTAASRDLVGPRLKASATLVLHKSKRRDREALGMRLTALGALLRDLAARGAGAPAGLGDSDLESSLATVASQFPPRRAVAAFGVVAEAQAALDRNASPKIVADWVAVKL